MFSLQVLGAVAQLERTLIAERTKFGVENCAVSWPRRRQPGLARRRPRRHRRTAGEPGCGAPRQDPGYPGHVAADGALDVTCLGLGRRQAVLDRSQTQNWSTERLRRTVRRLARNGIIQATLLGGAERQQGDDHLVRLVAGIKAAAPDRTLQQIAAQLEAMPPPERASAPARCMVGTESLAPRLIARIVQARALAEGFQATEFGGHSLKRGALTTAKDFGGHPSHLKRLGRHATFDVLGDYLEFGDLFENHPLSGIL